MRNIIRGIALIGSASVVLSGCASGPEIEKYPRRQIDRPYTLPDGVDAWAFTAGWGYSSVQRTKMHFDQYDDPYYGPYTDAFSYSVLNSTWQQSLSDDWTLLWLPIPLGVMHQFMRTSSDLLGATFATGFAYSSVNGFDLRPTLNLQERHYFSKSVALNITPSLTLRTPFQEGQSFDWSLGITIAPLFQLTDTLTFQPGITLKTVQTEPTNYGFITDNGILTPNARQFVIPLSAQLSWNLSRHWDLAATYSYSSIGYKDDYKNHTGALGTVFYW